MAPQRTCIGCGQVGERTQLVRVVARTTPVDGQVFVVVDDRAVMAGRGAWLHCDAACLTKAERRRAFHRSLRVAGELDVHFVHDWFAAVCAGHGKFPRVDRIWKRVSI